MFQEAAVKSRAQAKGVHQVDAEKKNGFIRFGVWDYFTLCTERGLWVHIKHKHKEGLLPWFGILPWRENLGEPKVTKRSAFNPSLVPEPQLWRECQQQCGVLPVWLHLCSPAMRTPEIAAGTFLTTQRQTEHSKTWAGKNSNCLKRQEGHKFPCC